MATKKKLLQAAAGNAGGAGLNVEEVFSTYLYTGNASTQTITNGIDLDGEGGLVWIKSRTNAGFHFLFDTERGAEKALSSELTNGEISRTGSLTAFNSNGFSVGSFAASNGSGQDYASWTFLKSKRFFDIQTYTGDGTGNQDIPHDLGATPGCIIVKRTDTTEDWWVYHRSISANDQLKLNSTAVAGVGSFRFGVDGSNFDMNQSTFSVGGGSFGALDLNQNNATYVAYLFAHNDGDGEFGPDGDADIIKCGNYTGNGSATGPVIDLGFEPQWVLIKETSDTGNWQLFDSMRGMVVDGSDARFAPNLSSAEDSIQALTPTATGFQINTTSGNINTNNSNYIYIAIRRGTAVPASGTEVFAPNFYGTSGYVGYLGAPADMHMLGYRNGGSQNAITSSRLIQGNKALVTSSNAAEITSNSSWDNMLGVTPVGTTLTTLISYTWKRAPKFMDCVAYTGDGTTARAISHNLGVPPQLMIHKRRNATNDWYVPDFINSKILLLNYNLSAFDTSILANYYGSGNGSSGGAGSLVTPNASTFTVTPNPNVNASGGTYVVYLFASLAGISKVGSVTHSGTTNVDCGFTSGARFILLKRTDASGDWYVWDSERGIVSGNDPYLLLNSTAAEVTNTDYIDPLSSGFTITSSFTAGDYIFYAIA